MAFLPISKQDMASLGWTQADFVYVVGEGYVDHPAFGQAIISRVLENAGYKVAMLCLPDLKDPDAFKRFGEPRLGFLVSAGGIDSMVNHYTVAKKRRNEDAYAPGGKAGMRPDRATIVYCNHIRRVYSHTPIFIGGLEASLRRFSHYDYWDNKIRRSILVDSAATALMFGMGEKSVVALAKWSENGCHKEQLSSINGICYMQKTPLDTAIHLPSHSDVVNSKTSYAEAFITQYNEQDPIRGHTLCQMQDKDRYLIQTKPDTPLTRQEMDAVYALPYMRNYHPMYEKLGGIPALNEVRFSITSTRGCFGACHFCALTFHQGRIVVSRSHESILDEAKLLTKLKEFKGYIHDVGGPTANFLNPACDKQLKKGACKNRQCLSPTPCKHLSTSHSDLTQLLRKMRSLPNVKKVFIRSGLRFDYIMADKDSTFLRELSKHHISGQLKVAPEHVNPTALSYMGKPDFDVYRRFTKRYQDINKALNLKQYLVPYFMSSHPGCDLNAAITLAEYLRDSGHQPEQVQDFYPTPGTLSTCMFYTGIDPRSMKPVYVPRSPEEKAMQRALLQYRYPRNHELVRKALRLADRDDLIGYSRYCLVPNKQVKRRR